MSSERKILPDEELVKTIDAMMSEYFKPDEPGAAIIVTRNGKPLFRKGYGMANLELGVAIEPHMVFRLGSITKQFTSVCILMLAEQGKLDFQDDITRFLPDYPTQAHTITIEHLLTHTSGIKSYTNMPEFMKFMRTDMSLEELIDVFKLQPMEFAPGTRFNYNNSGYVLLGAIVEKASGMTYTEFLQQNIFSPLGMEHSYFDMPSPIIPGRVAGYKPAAEGYENADYISMTLPHGAGSLASSVDDMAKWDAALYTEKLVKQESLKKAWTSYVLKDGTPTGYGYGWAVSNFQGHNMIIHGGGINGFVTEGFRFPEEKVYVSILTNRQKEVPNEMAFKIGALVAGKPYEEPVAMDMSPAAYKNYEAVYRNTPVGFDFPIMVEEGMLVAMMPTGSKETLIPVSKTEFATKGSVSRLIFELDDDGQAQSVTLRGFYGPGMVAVRTDEPLPSQRESIELDPAVVEQYAGEYELAPGQSIQFTLEEGKLIAHVPGQPAYPLWAETETHFFLKELPVKFEFQKDAAGKITGMVLNQGGRELQAKKVK
jgi:CubicO group peptidase (beta-lactamase class C family)